MNILYSWLGKTDINNMKKDVSGPISVIALKMAQPFDKIVIVANSWDEDWIDYENWLKKKLAIAHRPYEDVSINRVRIASPIDYKSISDVSQKWINKLSADSESLYINLSSGTPAMSAVSVILGKGKNNTNFCQSREGGEIFIDDIPFNFVAEYDASVARSISSKASTLPVQSKAFKDITATSNQMKSVIEKAEKLAELDLPVLVLGETGTGKEVISNAIHKGSNRSSKAIKTVNCGALPENLVDSILFGHVKGAFTGAVKDHSGLFEQADGGTLFLDEVGELTPDAQVKLLRALQQGEVTRVGDDKSTNVDVRVIAATHRDLSEMVANGEFREDLFYRLAVGVIEIPALRNRMEDIEPLTEALVNEINSTASKYKNYKAKSISTKAMQFIRSQPWRGNVRELWSTLNRALLLSNNVEITEQDIIGSLIQRTNKDNNLDVHLSLGDVVDLNKIKEDIERAYVTAALKATGNAKVKTAKMLGLGVHQNLDTLLNKLKIEIPKKRQGKKA